MNLYAIILAGGSGTRFWPVSRVHVPKQFLVLQGTQSLLQTTAQRISPLIPPQRLYVVTAAHGGLIERSDVQSDIYRLLSDTELATMRASTALPKLVAAAAIPWETPGLVAGLAPSSSC